MLSKLARVVGLLLGLLVASAPGARAANPKEIDQALKGGIESLKARYTRGAAPAIDPNQGIGPTALVGLALLEGGVPITDPAVKTITEMVRDASYKQFHTYPVALCLMYLDRYQDRSGEASDVPLIQMLGVRLVAGQTRDGGWGYDCGTAIQGAEEQRLRASFKQGQLVAGTPDAGKGPPKLHPEVEKYGQGLLNTRNRPVGPGGAPAQGPPSDNSNTQFGVLAVWMARKHGVPVEEVLELVEKRFMQQQDNSGNWPYVPPPPGVMATASHGSPAMYCCGLLGMATSLARREERHKTNPPAPNPAPPAKPNPKPNDPFYNPPGATPPKAGAAPPKAGGGRPADDRDRVVQRGFAGLGLTIADQIRNNRGLVVVGPNVPQGHFDTYFLWSLERVGVIYGLDKIGGIDWYDVGSTALVRSQSPDGSWPFGRYTSEVNTAFAVLFLCKANIARDLSNKVQPTGAEMRAGTGPAATELLPNPPAAPTAPTAPGTPAPFELPNPSTDEGTALALKMLKATGPDWSKMLAEARDGKGTSFTRALVLAAEKADGERKKEARDALAERLCRMTAATLRDMLKGNEAELRRAAALACAMKDDKDHIPDLIGALGDTDEAVVRAAKAGLKSLTGKDFGPAAGASAKDRAAAVAAWREWYAKEKK